MSGATSVAHRRRRHRLSALALTALMSTTVLATEVPAHHAEQGFRNPSSTSAHGGIASFFRVVRLRFFSDGWQTYDPERDQVPLAAPSPATGSSSNATVTWVGHATVLVQHQGINVLTDPMFSERASPVPIVGPRRITRPAIAIEHLPPIHVVVISHNHYDHLDSASIKALGNRPVYFVPLGLQKWLRSRGIASDRVVEMDWWDARDHPAGDRDVRITAAPSQHFSGRGFTDRNASLWASWSVAWDDFRIWFGGDTGYNDQQFKEIGKRLGTIDLAMIPIGAYEPRSFMRAVHVNPEEAVRIHQDLGAAASMAIHWGAFSLSAEGVLTPMHALADARREAGIDESEFATFAVGETRRYATRSH